MPSLNYIPQFSVISVIDILVVAFIIYEFLKLIKGTRAIPMLVAVVLLVVRLLDGAPRTTADG